MPAARALTTHLAQRLRPLCAVVDTAAQTRWAGPTLATYRRGRQPQQLRKRARWLLRRVLRPFKNQSSVRGRAFRSFGSLSDNPSGRSSCVPAACQAQLTAPPPPFRTRHLSFIYRMHNARLNRVRSPPLSMNSRASSRVVPQAGRGATICPRQSRRQAIEDALRQHVGAGLKWEAMATFFLSLSFCPPVMDELFLPLCLHGIRVSRNDARQRSLQASPHCKERARLRQSRPRDIASRERGVVYLWQRRLLRGSCGDIKRVRPASRHLRRRIPPHSVQEMRARDCYGAPVACASGTAHRRPRDVSAARSGAKSDRALARAHRGACYQLREGLPSRRAALLLESGVTVK